VRATVVIRTLNEDRGIGRAIDAIQAQEHPVEILVIDSGSTDRTLAVAASRPGVRIHEMPAREFTFGRACNLGMQLTDTPALIFLSGHAWPADAKWSRALLRPFDDDEVAGVYGRQDPVPGQDPLRANGQVRAFALAADGRPFAHFSNANSAVRRAAWELVPFDESLSGAEDFAWARRVEALGRRVEYAYDAAVFHSHRDSLVAVHHRHRIEAAGLLAQSGPPRARDYLREWARWSRNESRRLARERELRWAGWAPLYFAARLAGDYRGRRAAFRRDPRQRWEAGLADEVAYWRMWMETRGAEWPEDFRQRFDPQSEMQPEIRRLVTVPPDGVVRILDVGSGPVTWIGKRWHPHRVEVTAVDALAGEWQSLLQTHGMEAPVPTIQGEGEQLVGLVPENHFDLAMARYSLDESHDPRRVLRQMIATVRPGGAVLISSRVRAADAEKRWGLQQWNLAVDDGVFTVEGGGKVVDLGADVADVADMEEATVEPRQWVRLVFRKR
jgi:glycosyltransferase involved in cell wall biosynthesis/SAM-dependent methyltransferase